jgi:3HB-oligomer hydrolase 3HBOH
MAHQHFSGRLFRGGHLILCIAALGATSTAHASRCDDLQRKLGDRLVDVVCFESTDLTTHGPNTTPANNSLPGLPAFAFTPQGDRAVLAQNAATGDTPIYKAVPGIQLQARFADDPTGQARFLLRLPSDWNGKLVVAGASATRSEFNGDFAWSDYVVQKGYAYASQNKGMLNLQFTSSSDPLACRLNPSVPPDSPLWVNFYDLGPDQQFTRWTQYMIEAAEVARSGLAQRYGHTPKFTYAVGTSNGGYQVRRAIETAPHLFDGGVDWEGTFVDAQGPNLLTDLPPAVLNYPDYVASAFNQTGTAAKNILAAGYPPDIKNTGGSYAFWTQHSNSYWELTWCQWQKRLDPNYQTYTSGAGNYNYTGRLSAPGSQVGAEVAAIATSGEIQRPLITVVGTMDALLPIDHHARAYARKVAAAQAAQPGSSPGEKPAFRLYEVQNGNHIESYKTSFPQLELIGPYARSAFDLLVDYVEHGQELPPDQCIPVGAPAIEEHPGQPGHCTALLVQ